MNVSIVTLFADGLLPAIGATSAFFVLMTRGWYRQLPLMLVAGLTTLLIAKLLSLIYQPEVARPFILAGVEPGAAFIDNPGFPSDHIVLAGAAIAAVGYVTRSWKIVAGLSVLLIVMGTARVLALVHTPLDIIGGLTAVIIGSIWYIGVRKEENVNG